MIKKKKTEVNEADTVKLVEKSSTDNSIKGLLQRQVDHEFFNERLYLSMALWCEEHGYVQTAKFFSEHALEEREHGMMFINHMANRKMKINPPKDKEVTREFSDLKAVFTAAIEQELETSKFIREIHQEALKTSDFALSIANKFIQEQLEEEQLFLSLMNLYDLCNSSKIDFEMEVMALKNSEDNKYKIASL
jgi:ferritin